MPFLSTVTPARAARGTVIAAAALALWVVPAGAAAAPQASAAHGSKRNADRDRDGLTDRHERGRFHTNPRRWDTDRDGLSDGDEVRKYKTNPRKADTDRDGLSDGDEVRKYKTNPRKADTDRDGISDGDEVRAGSDPRNPASPGPGTPGGGGTPPATGGGTPPGGGGTPPTGGGTPPADVTAPQTTLVNGTSGAQAATTATFTFSADETATFECRLDGGAYLPCTSPKSYTALADGPHTFDVRARDTAGNVDATPESAAWSVDATAPVTSITAGPSGTTTSTTAQIEFSADEDATFQCRLDGGAWAACTSAVVLTELALGSHTFEVRATDAVGNTDATPAQSTWTVEQLVPDTTITGGPSGTTAEFSATLTFTSPDPGVTFECRLNGSAWEACTSPTFYPDLLPGDQLFEVRAKTLGGGVVDPTPATRTWTVEEGGGGIS